MEKTIKRPLKINNVDSNDIAKLNDIIERTNLFIYNIYNFIKIYYIDKNTNENITCDNLYDIFNILKNGEEYINKDNVYYKFYINTFKDLYFNPIRQSPDDLISGSYLDQIMKNNIKVMISSLKNNITYHFDKHLNKFIKVYTQNTCKSRFKYNSLIKKCSTYEMYTDPNILGLIKILDMTKSIFGYFDYYALECLSKILNGKINKKNIMRTQNNIFNDNLEKIKVYEKEFNKEKNIIKNYIIGDNIDENLIPNIYEDIIAIKKNLMPILNKGYEEDLKTDPLKFIKNMIYINNYLEKNERKTFNVFPTRNNTIPKHITLDTASINVAFCNNHYSKIEESKREIWKKIFKFPNSFFTLGKKYLFSGTVQTDGVSISLIYTHKDNYIKKIKLNKIKHNAKNNSFKIKKDINDKIDKKYNAKLNGLTTKVLELNKELTLFKTKNNNKKETKKMFMQELSMSENIIKLEKELKSLNNKINVEKKKEVNIYKKEKEKENVIKKAISNEIQKENKKKFKKNIETLKENNKIDELKIINRLNKEFYYLNDLTESELDELRDEEKILYIDQGKTELIYVMNELNDKFMRYSSKERGLNIKTNHHMNNINNLMEMYGIYDENNLMKNLNKKTSESSKIKEIIKEMNIINERIYDKSKRKKLRKERLEMYIDKQKSEKHMIRKLIYQLGIETIEKLKEYTIIIGDWGGCNSLKNNKSTLGIGMKRILKNYVKNFYLIDEYNTSKISNINYNLYDKTKKSKDESLYKCKEHSLLLKSTSSTGDKKVILKSMHSILTFKLNKKHIDCENLKYDDSQEKILNDKIIVSKFIKRDKNAVLNFKIILKYYLLNGRDRPEAFKRESKKQS